MSRGGHSLPPIRSRTLLFLSYRDSSSSRFTRRQHRYSTDDEQLRLIDSDGPHHSVIDIAPPPKWADLSDQVEDLLQAATSSIQQLDKLHAKHALPGFADKSAEERQIEDITNTITAAFRKCHTLIQQIDPRRGHQFPPTQSLSQHELQAMTNLQKGLAAKVQQVSTSFRKKQRIYLEKLQGHSIKHQDLLVASGASSSKGTEGAIALEEDVLAATQTQSQIQPGVDIQSRDRELREIAKSIGSLAELFRDLSSLVIEQGTVLDSIEYNLDNTVVHMEEAVRELEVATRYQKNTGRRKCIFLLLLIIFGLILVLVFKPRRHDTVDTGEVSSSPR